MNETASPHPSLELLRAFDRGLLGRADWDNVRRHVTECDVCCHRLEGLPDDHLVELLRASAGGSGVRSGATVPDTLSPGGATDPEAPAAGPEVAAALAGHPRYRVRGPLGAGGMGAVFQAEHLLMDRVVALKVLHPRLTDRLDAVARFRQEVRAAARLAHPNIVTAYDADRAGDAHFLVMEYVDGVSLDRVVEQGGPVDVARACDWVRQAALGLQHAFERGMVHRDLKPQNLILTAAGQVKILDFGLARFVRESDPAAGVTPAGAVVGTPDYMAPEQARDPRAADVRADVYSLGCTLYHLLAGRPPFPEGTALQKLLAHQDQPPRPLTEIRTDVPPELDRVVARMLAKDPARRYQTPAEVARALAPFAPGAEDAAAKVQPRPGRRRWVVLTAAALLTVAAGGLAAWLLFGGPGRDGAGDGGNGEAGRAFVGEVRRLGGEAGPFTAVSFAADGRRALTARADHTVQLWDLDAGRPLGTLKGHTDTVLGLSPSADGRRAVSGGKDTTVRLWDLGKKRLLKTMEVHTSWVRGVHFLPNGRHVLSAGDDGRLLIWNTATNGGKTYRGHEGAVHAVTASPGGRYALTAGADGTVRLWDLRARPDTALLVFRGHTGPARAVAYAADGRYLVSGGDDGTVRLWRAKGREQLACLRGHAGAVTAVALAPDGRRALSGGEDRTVRLWDLERRKELARLEGHAGGVLAVAFTADGRQALSGGRDGTLRLWQLPAVRDRATRLRGHGDAVWSVALSADGTVLASGSSDQTARVWDVAAGKARFVLKGHKGPVWAVALTPDGRTLATGSSDHTVKLWDPATGEERRTLRGHADMLRGLTFSPDGKTLASGSWDGVIKLWDPATGAEKGTLTGHRGPALALAWSPDGTRLASGGGGVDADGKRLPNEIRLWDVATGAGKPFRPKPLGIVYGLAFSPDGRTLAATQYDLVMLWDVASGRELHTLKGHAGPTKRVAFTRDGRLLASAARDGTVKLWDVADGKERATLRGHIDAAVALALTPDGRTLASGGEDAAVRVWDVAAALRDNP